MPYVHPTKAVPGGCVIAFLGLFPIAFGVLFGWGAWKLWRVAPDERADNWGAQMLPFGGGAILCLLVGIALIALGLRLARRADMTDPQSGSKPTMRF